MSNRGCCRFVLALGCLAILGGCGGGSSGHHSRAEATTIPPCKVGASWKEGTERKFALACSPVGKDPAEALVGYAIPGGTSCVSVYVGRMDEPFDELCETPSSRWTIQCERQGCVHFFEHGRKQTVQDGPVAAATSSVRVLAEGEPLRGGVLFASVRGSLMRSIHAKEPFGFFVVSIPRCVESAAVRVELLGAGKKIGNADPWDVAVKRCPPASA